MTDCHITYNVIECHLRPLAENGAEIPGSVWIISDSIMDFDMTPEIEQGAKKIIRCHGQVKHIIEQNDTLVGADIKLTFCCESAEEEWIIGGCCGTIIYDAGSPPSAINYQNPTIEDQANAVPFEMKIVMEEVSGSDVTGYRELWFYQCLPTFANKKGDQDEYVNPSYVVHCIDNPNY